MEHTLMVIASITALGMLWLLSIVIGARWVRTYHRWAAPHVVRCPNDDAPAAAQLASEVALRISCCSRWPEHAHCTQRCLAEIRAADAS